MSTLSSGHRSQDPPSMPGERAESAQSRGKLQTPKGQAISSNKKATKDYKQSADEDETSTPGDLCDKGMKITELQQMGIALCVAAKLSQILRYIEAQHAERKCHLYVMKHKLNTMSFRFLVMQLHPSLTTLTR